ncbi:MAG: DUF983 domain-containing protein [Bacteroidetes bacterium]|nr:DUF983 domain-containing protein [Bacteroidota bacterium]
MIKKGNKLYSIIYQKCPVCHEGDFFHSHPYNLMKAGDIYERCSVCNSRYSKEPGFYYGAMYVGYGLGVLLFLLASLMVVVLGLQVELWRIFLVVAGALLILSPYFYALSKIIWANLFLHYQNK